LYSVYILRSLRTGRYYVGSTQDLEKRVLEHNAGKSRSGRAGGPWELVHREEFATRSMAVVREALIKSRGIARYLWDLAGSNR